MVFTTTQHPSMVRRLLEQQPDLATLKLQAAHTDFMGKLVISFIYFFIHLLLQQYTWQLVFDLMQGKSSNMYYIRL